MTRISPFAALGVTFFLSACAALFQPPAPKLGPPPPNPAPMPSVISLPVRVPTPQLAASLNGSLDKQLYKGSNIDIGSGQRMSMTVTRGPIVLATANGRLTASLKLRADLGIDGQVVGLKHHEDGEVDLKVTIATRFVVGGDYQVTSQTTGDLQVEKATIKIGPFNLSVKDQVEERVRPKFQEMVKQIDQRIVGYIDLKGAVGKTWTQLAQPVRIAASPETWLLIQPRTLRFAAPRSEGDDLVFGFAVECLTGVWMLRKPTPAESGGLPQLVLGGNPSGTVRLAFPFSIGHQEASKLATEALSKKPFDLKAGIKLRVKRADVSGSGDKLVAKVDFATTPGNLGGFLYFTGKPVYDEPSREMRVDDFDYDLGTRDLISRGADFLLHKEFVKAVQKDLVFPFGKKIDQKQAEFNAPGHEIKFGAFAVRLHIDKVAPSPVLEVTANDLRAYLVVEGRLEMSVGVK